MLVLLFATASLIGFADDPDSAKFEGTWKVSRVTADGTAIPQPGTPGRYVFRGDELSVPEPGTPDNKMSFAVDSTKLPKEIDITVLDAKAKGKKIRCIYEFKGETLTICFPQGKRELQDPSRPKVLDGGKGKSLVVLERFPAGK